MYRAIGEADPTAPSPSGGRLGWGLAPAAERDPHPNPPPAGEGVATLPQRGEASWAGCGGRVRSGRRAHRGNPHELRPANTRPGQEVRRLRRDRQRVAERHHRQPPRADRAERRRQDHADQPADRLPRAERGPGDSRRQRRDGLVAARARPTGRRAHVPDQPLVRRHGGARVGGRVAWQGASETLSAEPGRLDRLLGVAAR